MISELKAARDDLLRVNRETLDSIRQMSFRQRVGLAGALVSGSGFFEELVKKNSGYTTNPDLAAGLFFGWCISLGVMTYSREPNPSEPQRCQSVSFKRWLGL